MKITRFQFFLLPCVEFCRAHSRYEAALYKGGAFTWAEVEAGIPDGAEGGAVMNPKRLIAIETLKRGAALLAECKGAAGEHQRCLSAAKAWQDWAACYAGPIMESLTAFAALEEILNHTWITELVWWGTPGCFGLQTDTDQTSEEEGNWQDPTLAGVLRAAAADFSAADEFEEVNRG